MGIVAWVGKLFDRGDFVLDQVARYTEQGRGVLDEFEAKALSLAEAAEGLIAQSDELQERARVAAEQAAEAVRESEAFKGLAEKLRGLLGQVEDVLDGEDG